MRRCLYSSFYCFRLELWVFLGNLYVVKTPGEILVLVPCVLLGFIGYGMGGPDPREGAKSIVERRFHDTPGCQIPFDKLLQPA